MKSNLPQNNQHRIAWKASKNYRMTVRIFLVAEIILLILAVAHVISFLLVVIVIAVSAVIMSRMSQIAAKGNTLPSDVGIGGVDMGLTSKKTDKIIMGFIWGVLLVILIVIILAYSSK